MADNIDSLAQDLVRVTLQTHLRSGPKAPTPTSWNDFVAHLYFLNSQLRGTSDFQKDDVIANSLMTTIRFMGRTIEDEFKHVLMNFRFDSVMRGGSRDEPWLSLVNRAITQALGTIITRELLDQELAPTTGLGLIASDPPDTNGTGKGMGLTLIHI